MGRVVRMATGQSDRFVDRRGALPHLYTGRWILSVNLRFDNWIRQLTRHFEYFSIFAWLNWECVTTGSAKSRSSPRLSPTRGGTRMAASQYRRRSPINRLEQDRDPDGLIDWTDFC